MTESEEKKSRTNLIEMQKIIGLFMVVIRQLFLPQMYKIGTLIFQSLIYRPKFLPLTNNHLFPSFV